MKCLLPNKIGKTLAILCIILSLYSYFFTTFSLSFILELLILSILYTIMHIIIRKMDIRYAHTLSSFLIPICMIISFSFSTTPIGFKVIIYDFDKKLIKYSIDNCQNGCKISQDTIYDNNKNIVYKWVGIPKIYDGYINVKNNEIEYQLSLEKKCIKKEYNKKYIIIHNKCNN